MNREILDINDCTILLEEASTDNSLVDSCFFDEPVIAIAFYGAGDVGLKVKYEGKTKEFHHTKGMVLSFYADEQVEFEHHVSPDKPLQCLVIATTIRNLDKLPNGEGQFLEQFLSPLVHPKDHYVEGPVFKMSPEMFLLVEQFFSNTYEGGIKMLFYKSHMTGLLSHYFGQLAAQQSIQMDASQLEKINLAQEILLSDLENPPSLTELAHKIGTNTNTLKKEFKAQFGVPVFKYLQNERLKKAYNLIKNEQKTIQEAAWAVGYDSLGSFSNAFEKKFGYRPSQV
ncbi:helix-turn-helix domain-containing protein [Flagellimonas zhangzhouensis]|uniref:AraC-type DNA-binding protein n=1 Tax=Flagellimonas zhangzhouensis TaxID=1073328 RepID=A0A1H2VYH1_9FLAO|nr:AraC family transcriptional regulator [Allomuricauda zhangzhouensis]SDQ04894.1 AraC-type DNA-binding protein [Allomuricauda zhangzhouensis]SDW73276.1 AraC-type DNA-binding protein [Allomuricauda zhangzhouensis]